MPYVWIVEIKLHKNVYEHINLHRLINLEGEMIGTYVLGMTWGRYLPRRGIQLAINKNEHYDYEILPIK